MSEQNDFNDRTINHVLSTVKGYSASGADSMESPLYKASERIYNNLNNLKQSLTKINDDTTLTKDGALLMSADTADANLVDTITILDKAGRDVDDMLAHAESKLYSNSVYVDANVNALLGNDTILKEMRKDFTTYAKDKTMASLLNTFNKYGVTGSEDRRNSISTFLNNRYTPDVVTQITKINTHKQIVSDLGGTLKQMYNFLNTDPQRIKEIRMRKIS